MKWYKLKPVEYITCMQSQIYLVLHLTGLGFDVQNLFWTERVDKTVQNLFWTGLRRFKPSETIQNWLIITF